MSGLLEQLTPVIAEAVPESHLALFHTPDYIARIKGLSAERGGDASYRTRFGPGSFEIARRAVGGTCALVEAVAMGHVANGYALVRPPGHHAERDRGLCFYLFASVAIAFMKARSESLVDLVAVVDWDVHHGNGTQQAFYEAPTSSPSPFIRIVCIRSAREH